MTEAQHLEVAFRLNRLAEQLQSDGDDVAMAEMLWGTVNRITNAIAIQHQLGDGTRLPRVGSVIHHLVRAHQVQLDLQHGVHAVGALHGHFYNSHLRPQDVEGHVVETQGFIANLLDLYDNHANQ